MMVDQATRKRRDMNKSKSRPKRKALTKNTDQHPQLHCVDHNGKLHVHAAMPVCTPASLTLLPWKGDVMMGTIN